MWQPERSSGLAIIVFRPLIFIPSLSHYHIYPIAHYTMKHLKTYNYKEALNKAANLCSRKEKCASDIEKKISGWGLTPEESDQGIDWLVENKFIDNERFARFFVRDKFRFNRWGKIKIAHALRQKQLPAEIIELALNQEIDAQDYINTLEKLLRSKAKRTIAIDLYEKKAKLARFAAGRGFEQDLVFSVIDRIVENGE